MTEKEQREIFARNFRWYVDSCGKTQRVIAKELGYSYTTVNTWYRGAALPNAAKIQTIADYFGISKSNLLDDVTDPVDGVQTDVHPSSYYIDAETRQLAQELHDNPDLSVMLDAYKTLSPRDAKLVMEMVRRMQNEGTD